MPRPEDIQIVIASEESGINRRIVATTKSLTVADIGVYVMVLGLTALQLGLYQRADDFVYDIVSYFDLARSLIETGSYGFNFKPETVQPPGLSAILALICVTVGCGYAILLRSMAIFLALGFIVSYELLKREQGRAAAAVSCLLPDSSPIIFAIVTRSIWPCFPYFFTTMLALLVAAKLETAQNPRAQAALGLLFCFLVVVSLMIESAGIALLTGLIGWLAVSFFANRKVAAWRLKIFLLPLILGIVVQVLWMQQKGNVSEWPLPGYPESYLSQLQVKSGNYPELGMASLSDIVLRMGRNLCDRSLLLAEMLTRYWINPHWSSPAVTGLVLLVLLGVGCSILRTGGCLHDWYFVSHEAIYLLWPWSLEVRFLVPVVPLACLYLWRGGETLLRLTSQRPRTVGMWCLPLFILLGVCSGVWAWGSESIGGVQAKLSVVFWVMLAMVSVWIVGGGSHQFLVACYKLRRYSGTILSLRRKPVTLLQVVSVIVLVSLIGRGLAMQLSLGRDNLNFKLTQSGGYPDIEAAEWIQAHTARTTVIMARHVPTAYHYSRRKVIWFPPITNPQVLMDGIRKYNVQYIIVVDRTDSYYLPPERSCFEPLYRAYREVFRLVHESPQVRIFEVLLDGHSYSGERLSGQSGYSPVVEESRGA